MLKLRTLMIVALTIALPMMLGQCDNSSANQPPLSQAEAIKLAKVAAAQLQSPPRFYSEDKNGLSRWADEPGSITDHWTIAGGVATSPYGVSSPLPVTYTIVLTSGNLDAGITVAFLVTWEESNEVEQQHSWQLQIASDRRVTLVKEIGDSLPSIGCGDRCS